jgi:hypothetical protein
MVLMCSATLNRLEITTTDLKKKKKFLLIKIQKTWNLHQHSKSLTRTIPVVLLCLFYKGTSSEEFVDALSEQCHGDVLPTKLRPVKIEDENENDWNIWG